MGVGGLQMSDAEQTNIGDMQKITPEEALTFFHMSGDVFSILNERGKLLKTNPAHTAMFGALEEFSQCESVMDMIHPDDRAEASVRFQASLEDPTIINEVRNRTSDGSYRWMSWKGILVRGENKIYGIGRDITERKLAEQRVKQLASIVECSRDAIIGIDLNHRITSWNRGATLLFGYSSQAAELLLGPDLFEDMEADDFHEICDSSIETELVCVRSNLSTFFGSVYISPVVVEKEQVIGYSIVIRDISERKEMETRVREFYSTVSHELRTPLTSIRGALGLLQSCTVAPESDEGREMLQVARDSADRLIRLINDILDVQKIEAGRMELQLEMLQPHDVARKAIAEVAGMAEEFNVAIDFDTSLPLPAIMADRDKTIQIIANLLSNAIKFSGDGRRVAVCTTRSGRRVRFSVTDSGDGIPADKAHKVFGKFQQLDSSDTRSHGGTGLGLAICKALVEQQGGSIGFHNEHGGCTFWFDVPCAADSTDAVVTSDETAPHVLLVEDDAQLSYVMAKLLNASGYIASVAGNLASAKRLLKEDVPDAILLDLKLPDGDGREIINYLNECGIADIPVLVVTGADNQNKNDDSMVVSWIAKPFELDVLLGALRRALKMTRPKVVAVIDDDPGLRSVLSAQLTAAGIRCVQAADGLQALSVIDEHQPDLLILDVAMPRCNGYQLVEKLRSRDKIYPVLLYSGQELGKADLDCLQLGLTMALTKGRVDQTTFVETVVSLLQRASERADSPCEDEFISGRHDFESPPAVSMARLGPLWDRRCSIEHKRESRLSG